MNKILKKITGILTFRTGFILLGIALVGYGIVYFESIACSGYSYIPSFLMVTLLITLFTATLGGLILICTIIKRLIDIAAKINARRKSM